MSQGWLIQRPYAAVKQGARLRDAQGGLRHIVTLLLRLFDELNQDWIFELRPPGNQRDRVALVRQRLLPGDGFSVPLRGLLAIVIRSKRDTCGKKQHQRGC